MIELFLSTDGKHTVHVVAETPDELEELLPHAHKLYSEVLRTYGSKVQMWQGVMAAKGNGEAQNGSSIQTPAQVSDDGAPQCPVHKRPMVLRNGKFGPFWRCPERRPDNRWCPVTQDAVSGEYEARP
jgi:hypothetical protein